MNEQLQALLDEIRGLEQRVADELAREKTKLGYQIRQGRVVFEQEIARRHQELKTNIARYVRESSVPVALTAPLVYAMLLPLVLLDVFLWLYQGVCFPIWGIPKAKRDEYLIFDRIQLRYLNLIERVHCAYCSYANGLVAYACEIAARSEQYWCPIKHAKQVKAPHSRYFDFFAYGDAESYAKDLEKLRRQFAEMKKPEAR